MPIIARCRGLGCGIIISGCGGEIGIARTNRNRRPFCSIAAVIYACETAAIIERIITNTRHAVGDRDACEAGAFIKRRIANARHAVADIDTWNRGEIPVALAHPASIGYGLNLQDGGHILIWFGLPWSLELYQQANERLNRPGQKNICRVYRLILQGTHDERVLKSLQKKEKGQAAAI